MAPGGARRERLVQALELESPGSLYRECERKTLPGLDWDVSAPESGIPPPKSRTLACPLFWTLGPNQVGKAAITGWREVLQPALQRDYRSEIGLWPFDGALEELLEARQVVICETYPVEAYRHLGLARDGGRWSKRRAADRRQHAQQLRRWASHHGVLSTPGMAQMIRTGFGTDRRDEDRFDAVIGLMSIIGIILGSIPECPSLSQETRRVEGWIMGRV